MIAAALNRPVPGCVLRLGDALGGRRSTRQAFGREQLDVDGGQRVDRLERGRGRVEIDARAVGSASHVGQPRGEHLDVDAAPWRGIRRASAGTVPRRRGRTAAGLADGDVVGCAPPAAIVGVDQLERQRPIAERLVGQRQAQAGPDDRLALGAADGLIEDRRQIVERLTELGVGAELTGRRAEGPCCGARRPCGDAPSVGDRRMPAGPGQQQPRRSGRRTSR